MQEDCESDENKPTSAPEGGLICLKSFKYNHVPLECSGSEESKPKEYDIDVGKELHFGCTSGCLKIIKVLSQAIE